MAASSQTQNSLIASSIRVLCYGKYLYLESLDWLKIDNKIEYIRKNRGVSKIMAWPK
jgi:hypothetical protein